MRKLYILCQRYFNEKFDEVTIGGIQTYITNLCQVANKNGLKCVILQYANKNHRQAFEYGEVIGVDVSGLKHLRHKNKALFLKSQEEFDRDSDLLIYATEGMAQAESRAYALGIQHGISWDIESTQPKSRLQNVLGIFEKALKAVLLTGNAFNVHKLVCVDYNYLNWYRTQIKHHETDCVVIPNFTTIAPEMVGKQEKDDTIKLLFARRFQPYRGTRLFAAVIKRLLDEHNNLEVTFAGDGPDEAWLKQTMSCYDNVHFITYRSDESLAVHADKHIAVIPTTGSEGTSLSLLEAMSSQCAVVCTNVGGMTNIVIDHYNGLMVNPDEVDLYGALKTLIEDRGLRVELAKNGYQTVKSAFSREIWENRWTKVLQESACEKI